jgi:hypothetical protein
MKRFILASVLAAFACALSVQAGEPDKACAKAKAACCAEQAKAASTASDCCAKETKAKVIAKGLLRKARCCWSSASSLLFSTLARVIAAVAGFTAAAANSLFTVQTNPPAEACPLVGVNCAPSTAQAGGRTARIVVFLERGLIAQECHLQAGPAMSSRTAVARTSEFRPCSG